MSRSILPAIVLTCALCADAHAALRVALVSAGAEKGVENPLAVAEVKLAEAPGASANDACRPTAGPGQRHSSPWV